MTGRAGPAGPVRPARLAPVAAAGSPAGTLALLAVRSSSAAASHALFSRRLREHRRDVPHAGVRAVRDLLRRHPDLDVPGPPMRLDTFAEVEDVALPVGPAGEVIDVAVADLSAVVTECRDFDARWRPTGEHVRARWVAAEQAARTGRSWILPRLWDVDGRYYVLDGHALVSAAAAHGAEVTAEVTARFTLVPGARHLAGATDPGPR